MTEHDSSDRRLEEQLQAGSRLSAAYREAAAEEPAAALDQAILAAARREAQAAPRVAYSPFTRVWRVPLALAAVLVVSVTVTLLTLEESGEPLPPARRPAADGVPAAAERPATVERPAAPAREAAPAPRAQPAAPPAKLEQAATPPPPAAAPSRAKAQPAPAATRELARPAAPAAGLQRAKEAQEDAAAAAPARSEAAPGLPVTAAPEEWLMRVEQLRREGRYAEAEALLAEFRRRFPDHPLPGKAPPR